MKLLNTYDDHDEAEDAAEKLTGDKRLASERDATVVIYNLFGIPVRATLSPWHVQLGRAKDALKKTFPENHKPVTMRLTGHVIL